MDPVKLITAQRRKVFNPIIEERPWCWESDSAYLDGFAPTETARVPSKRAVIVFVERTSRAVFAYVCPGPSANGTQVVAALKKLQERYPVQFLLTDSGREF